MDTILGRNNITERINAIIEKRFNINCEALCENYYLENLLGRKFGFGPRDLVYLFLEIEREFKIKITQEDIINNSFTTIKGIIDIILSQSNKIVRF